MAEYIEREKDKYIKLSQALEVLDSCACWWAHERMESIPAADVRPVVRGKWIDGKCNQCGEHAPFWPMASTYYESDFCPNCGAAMDEEGKA